MHAAAQSIAGVCSCTAHFLKHHKEREGNTTPPLVFPSGFLMRADPHAPRMIASPTSFKPKFHKLQTKPAAGTHPLLALLRVMCE